MTNEVIVHEDEERYVAPVANPLDVPADKFAQALDRRGTNRKALIAWVRESLVDGVDYGRIQTRRGPSKPSLYKPGAEKVCGMLGLRVVFPTLHEYEQRALSGQPIDDIILRCHLLDAGGNVVADGIGARSVSKEGGDLNKALKMALKSAHIDATLRCAGLSEIFTQDVEDMPEVRDEGPGVEPSEIVLGFGKYSGEQLGWIVSRDHGYVVWLAQNAREPWLREAARALLDGVEAPDDLAEAEQRLKDCETVEQLREVFEGLPVQHKRKLEALKEALKRVLTETDEWVQGFESEEGKR